MATTTARLAPQEWAARYRAEDGEQQPISIVERRFGPEAQTRRHGLELMRPLVAALGDPQSCYPTVHVTGSKGKGSVVTLLSSILRAAGYRVGSYISPSLMEFNERIQVDGQWITESELAECVAELERAAAGFQQRPKFFEATTAIAFLHFARRAVDVAVVEVGIGGRRDATNVICPEVAVITSIELEHTQILGSTLAAIAEEKAGIIKAGAPVVVGVSEPEPLGPIQRRCRQVGSPLRRLGLDFGVANQRQQRHGQWLDLWLSSRTCLRDVELTLAGAAQGGNAAVAAATATLMRHQFPQIDQTAIRSGLRQARWPGRLELHPGRPQVLLDIAHTPESVGQLRHYLERFFPTAPKALVFGLLREKKAEQLAAVLAPLFDTVVVAPVKWFRTMEPERLAAAFRPWGADVSVAPSVCAGVELALAASPRHGLVVVAGSVFAVGEAKRRFGW